MSHYSANYEWLFGAQSIINISNGALQTNRSFAVYRSCVIFEFIRRDDLVMKYFIATMMMLLDLKTRDVMSLMRNRAQSDSIWPLND